MTSTSGACAICLAELGPEEEAFLDECWHHHFHFTCIRRWAEHQLEQAPPAGSHGHVLACPLCRRPFASAIYDCHDTTYRRHYFLPSSSSRHNGGKGGSVAGNGSGSLLLTLQHRRRHAVYSTPLDAAERRRLEQHRLVPQQVQRPEVDEFLRRDLQALILQQDVGLVAQHVLGTLHNAVAAATAAVAARPQQLHQAAKRIPAKLAVLAIHGQPARPAYDSSIAGVPLVEVAARVQAAVAPFLFEHAERFAWEVVAFATSGCTSLAAYDRQTLQLDAAAAAAAAAEARQQLQEHQRPGAGTGAGGRPRHHYVSDSGDGGYSSGSDSGGGEIEACWGRQQSVEPQQSDSEGYLELLLMQGRSRQRQQQHGASALPEGPPGACAVEAQPVMVLPAMAPPAMVLAVQQDGGDSCPEPARGRRRSSRRAGGSRSSGGSNEGNSRHCSQHRKHKRRQQWDRSRSKRRLRGGRRWGFSEDAGSPGAEARGYCAEQAAPALCPMSGNGAGDSAVLPAADELAMLREQALLALQQHRRQQEQQGG